MKEITLRITHIGLATVKDVKECHKLIGMATESWWVRDTDDIREVALAYLDAGRHPERIKKSVGCSDIYRGIRPKLTIMKADCKGFAIGDKVEMFGNKWTFIRKNEILCDTCIATGPWDYPYPYVLESADECVRYTVTYAGSSLEAFLEGWLKKQ